ncbi:MAG: hypothetical protein MI802_00675, partial [Desulfobacterales bacterium]|nr:hypothetical protein [Desulfobacterales bacterium]
RYYPDAMFAGQGSAFWPVVGEPLGFYFSFMKDYMALSGSLTDVVSWHYYPQQSRRGLIASRRAAPSRLLNPDNLNEAAHWGGQIRALRDRHAEGKPVWLGETGNAQFGGEPGLSDRYLAGLWWLDQLGLLARTGHDVIVRQTLSGMDYGMIDPDTLTPAPDYWNSLLWKRFMGRDVYGVRVEGAEKLRAYAHSHPERKGVLSLLLINLDHESSVLAHLPKVFKGPVEVMQLGTEDLFSKDLYLNGKKLELVDDALPEIKGRIWKNESGAFSVKPLTGVFLTGRI